MNYLEQWTAVPELPKDKSEIQFYRYTLLDPMTEGTIGAGLSNVYYSREALDNLRKSLIFSTPTSNVGYSYEYSFQNSLPKPSLPYYPLSV